MGSFITGTLQQYWNSCLVHGLLPQQAQKATNLAASHAAKRGLETANSSLDFAPLNIIAYKVSLFF